jgi:hypothetical protein
LIALFSYSKNIQAFQWPSWSLGGAEEADLFNFQPNVRQCIAPDQAEDDRNSATHKNVIASLRRPVF